jgi:hypothetical protein
VADALMESGISETGTSIAVEGIIGADTAQLAKAFPSFAPLLARRDLGPQNRSLFLIRELLKRGRRRLRPGPSLISPTPGLPERRGEAGRWPRSEQRSCRRQPGSRADQRSIQTGCRR